MSKSLLSLFPLLAALSTAAPAAAEYRSDREVQKVSTEHAAVRQSLQVRLNDTGMILSRGGIDLHLSTPLVISTSDIQDDRPHRDDVPFVLGLCVRVGFNF